MDQEYIDLCRDEMNAIAEASQILWMEKVDADSTDEPWTQESLDLRRAELYKQHLDAAGIEIRRKG